MASDKTVLRREFALRREALSEARRAELDLSVRALLADWGVFRSASAVAAFAAFGAEPELLPLALEKAWFLPRWSAATAQYELVEIRDPRRDLRSGKYGIREPLPELPALPEREWNQLLFLVPALACDRFGTRLGRGGGHYDRMLRPGDRAAAVIYDCQVAEFPLPSEEHDRRVAWIVTESAVIDCAKSEK